MSIFWWIQTRSLKKIFIDGRKKLAEEIVEGAAGGGVIKVELTGDQRCKSVEIDPALLEDADVEMLQDLVLAAVNAALDASRELAKQRLGPLSGGMF